MFESEITQAVHNIDVKTNYSVNVIQNLNFLMELLGKDSNLKNKEKKVLKFIYKNINM